MIYLNTKEGKKKIQRFTETKEHIQVCETSKISQPYHLPGKY